MGACFAVLSYAGLTTGAAGPAYGSLGGTGEGPGAVLAMSGAVVAPGTIHDIFSSGAFSGPNRAEKQDRQRPLPDVMAVASSFDAIRARLAALRQPAAAVAAAPAAVAPVAAA
ncbi:hypothetical protein, partial [Devosia sp.]|uniref:hypothetical protein n=1 Tax=Devosia sp. TaxID=1871048 RepID=UPI002F0704F6